MKVILDIGIFAVVIAASFYVGCMFGAKYVLHLLEKEGYRKETEKKNV